MKEPLRPVAHVDLSRYMGDWYVIANIPYFAEKNCYDSIESYALRPDGKIDNQFTCRKNSFEAPLERKASAVASVKYVILDLDPNYQWVLVGHPSRSYGWVMSRSKTMDEALYQRILQSAAAQGYDTAKFAKVPQRAGTDATVPDPRRDPGGGARHRAGQPAFRQ